MRIRGRKASPGLALAIAIPLIPCFAYLASSQPPALRCATASCPAVSSRTGLARSSPAAGGTAPQQGTQAAQPGACTGPARTAEPGAQDRLSARVP
jgi:hypothetical protein